MPYCKYCGRHVPESEGTICETCIEKVEAEETEQLPYPLLLAPPRPKNPGKSYTKMLVLSILVGAGLLFFLIGRRILL